MGKTLRILAIHGVGHLEKSKPYQLEWQAQWRNAIDAGVAQWDPRLTCDYAFLEYDHLFARSGADAGEVAEAMLKLTSSAVLRGLEDLLPPRRGLLDDLKESLEWTLGMVAQWVADEQLRTDLCKLLKAEIKRYQPDVIIAHSLGSLISYDLLRQEPDIAEGAHYVTLGSQIGNPGVRGQFGGYLAAPEQLRSWFNLYNAEDAVAVVPIRLAHDPRFREINTHFDMDGMLDHDADRYLAHQAAGRAWRVIAGRETSLTRRIAGATRTLRRKPTRRALLVGINDYPQEADRLQGCVNDVFEMSATLQSAGFDAEDVRTAFDARATAKGIRDRLEWLLDGVQEGDQRVFFYSGHGARLPSYSATEKVDHQDECLVPHDFDWSAERAITDDWFCELYSQLPYGADFVAVFDACHSGGMTRDGAVRARGLNPPDDIRHRALRWDKEKELWLARDLPMSGRSLLSSERDAGAFLSERGDTLRLGRGVSLWTEVKQFQAARRRYRHHGPYLPVLLEACAEHQYAYEYRHGVTSHGAFTFILTHELRRALSARKRISFHELMARTTSGIRALGYDQTPALVGPRVRLEAPIPW